MLWSSITELLCINPFHRHYRNEYTLTTRTDISGTKWRLLQNMLKTLWRCFNQIISGTSTEQNKQAIEHLTPCILYCITIMAYTIVISWSWILNVLLVQRISPCVPHRYIVCHRDELSTFDCGLHVMLEDSLNYITNFSIIVSCGGDQKQPTYDCSCITLKIELETIFQ